MKIGDLVKHSFSYERTGNIGIILDIDNVSARVKWFKKSRLEQWHALYEVEKL